MNTIARLLAAFALAATSLAMPNIAAAQEKTAIRDGFEFRQDRQARVLLFRPSIKVGAQSTGGMFEPRAEWTEAARVNIEAALDSYQANLGHVVVEQPETFGDDAQLVREYQALFGAVARSVIDYQFFIGNRLETKKQDNRDDKFRWSLGPGVADLPGAENADYVLFINTEDHYGSTGRKIFQALAAISVGYGVKSGLHAGYAGLVDLKTGDLLWINADYAMGGDVREADGAEKRVRQLLEEFPLASEGAETEG